MMKKDNLIISKSTNKLTHPNKHNRLRGGLHTAEKRLTKLLEAQTLRKALLHGSVENTERLEAHRTSATKALGSEPILAAIDKTGTTQTAPEKVQETFRGFWKTYLNPQCA